jgi:putative toxin-antitoxin system antitoxin component (TIGR02293 family)
VVENDEVRRIQPGYQTDIHLQHPPGARSTSVTLAPSSRTHLPADAICRYNGRQMPNELQAVLRQLGGKRVLGRSLANDRDLREAIREGFPHAVVGELMQASGLTLKELAGALDLSARSLQRRRRGRLARFESDRLYRMARLLALARETLGDGQRASRWLKRTNRALGGVAPIAAIDTELGARQVENILGRIAYGGMS